MVITTLIQTPVGRLIAGATDAGICLLDFPYRKAMPAIQARMEAMLGEGFHNGSHSLLDRLRLQLEEYFSGVRKRFDMPLQFCGSGFQETVWRALLEIPYATTRSYKEQSELLNNTGAIRAIAKANGDNCIMLLVPCHRVIGEDGSLTGYAGGLHAKQWLLAHERKGAGLEVQGELF